MHHSDDPRHSSPALTCYCDDSGSHDQAKETVVGAVLMSRPRFIEFNEDWIKMLKEFKLISIHMQDFVRPHGRHCTMPKEMKKALFTTVAKNINRYKSYSISVGVPQADYKSMLSPAVCRGLMGPYAMAFFCIVLGNRTASMIRHYNNRIMYLVDEGNQHHHDQLHAAHTVMLWLEKNRGERYTGDMKSDFDDNNNALQAADVVAWVDHRIRESGEPGEEFSPLLNVLKESQIPAREDGAVSRPHIKLNIPPDGIAVFAKIINDWINNCGDLPTWDNLMNS
jgi:hypothetical protein